VTLLIACLISGKDSASPPLFRRYLQCHCHRLHRHHDPKTPKSIYRLCRFLMPQSKKSRRVAVSPMFLSPKSASWVSSLMLVIVFVPLGIKKRLTFSNRLYCTACGNNNIKVLIGAYFEHFVNVSRCCTVFAFEVRANHIHQYGAY
jgi:hypothetical protein